MRRRKKLIEHLKNAQNELSEQEIQDILLENMINTVEQECSLSVQLLKNHIRQNHPLKSNDKWWPLLSYPGAFFSTEPKRDIPDFIRDIGLGPSLYLLTLKALCKIFLSLTILNLPAFYFFYCGTESKNRDLSSMSQFFAQFAMGNLGEQGLTCSTLHLGQNSQELELQCTSGVLSHVVSYGLKREVDQTCDPRKIKNQLAYTDENGGYVETEKILKYDFGSLLEDSKSYIRNYVKYFPSCSTLTFADTLSSDFTKQLVRYFEDKCFEKTHCSFEMDYKLLNPACIEEIEARAASSRSIALAQHFNIE